jgi:tetratricopeptide (TPR) repeat protein/tRNA A-37 threonylcarbamoyl transferase component Bud32
MNEERLTALLLAWQEQQFLGHDVPAAELCHDCPELAAELSQRIHMLRQVNSLMGIGETVSGLHSPEAQFTRDTRAWQTVQAKDSTAETRPAGSLPGSVPGYEILGELGRGGMGVVYKARQQNLKRIVALKMILAGSHASPEARVRFLHEAETIARLKHPNVVQVFDFGTHEGKPYFSLEYLEGGSLARKLRGEPQAPMQAARLLETLARAVQAAHAQGIVHRDLKPANVLLSADGAPKITDFGLAKQGDSGMTATGAVLGTPSYMAPEQAEGKTRDVGPAADVYALGAILYELLTGRPPFKGGTPVDTLQQVVADEPVPPSRLQPKVPRDLETIGLKCLQKDPAKRYASALELAEDLHRFQSGESIRARPVRAHERAWRWCRRNPLVAGLSALLLLVLVAGLGAVTHLWLQAEDQRLKAVEESQRAGILATKARQQQAAAEAQKTVALKQSKRARAEAAKATKIVQILAKMFEASDPLGLNNLPLPKPKRADVLATRKLLDRAAELIARELSEEPDVQARLLDTIGNIYCTLGFPDRARPFLDRALALRRRALPKDHPDVAVTLHNLAWLQHQNGNYTQARQLYREALAIRRRDSAHPLPAAATMLNLGWLLADMEDFALAETMLKEVVALRCRYQGKGHRDVAVARVGLAGVFLAQGKFLDAVKPYLQARATLLKVEGGKELAESIDLMQRGVLLHGLPRAVSSVFGLGGAHEAVGCLQRSLKLARQELGDQHAYVGLVLHELARAENSAGQYAAAEQHFRDCLRIARRYGLEHPKSTILLRTFCAFLRDRGKPDEANKLLAEALHERRRRRGLKHHLVADILLLSVELSLASAEHSARERLLREAAAIYRQSRDASRRNRIAGLNLLAVSLAVTRPAEAEQLLREAIPLARKYFGPRHASLALLLCNLAMVRMNQNHFDKVEPVVQEAFGIIRTGGGSDIGIRRTAWRCLARYYLGTRQPAKAGAAVLERRKLAGENAHELFDVACELGQCAAAFRPQDPESIKYADLALETLRRAKARGFKDARLLRTARTLDPLRGRPDFQKLLQEVDGSGKTVKRKK